jgi:SulP family sulfate permease
MYQTSDWSLARAVMDISARARLDAIEPLLRRAHYEKGSVIFREGDPSDELLIVIVTNGTASAYLQLPQMNVQLASFAPGTMFGELALLDQGPRSATVIADEELVCYALNKANFAVLAAKVPDVAIRLVVAIGRELSGRLRGANRTIHQERWSSYGGPCRHDEPLLKFLLLSKNLLGREPWSLALDPDLQLRWVPAYSRR